MCYGIRELSKKRVREAKPEHIVERPAAGPETVGSRGVVALVRSLLEKVAPRKAVHRKEKEVAVVQGLEGNALSAYYDRKL